MSGTNRVNLAHTNSRRQVALDNLDAQIKLLESGEPYPRSNRKGGGEITVEERADKLARALDEKRTLTERISRGRSWR